MVGVQQRMLEYKESFEQAWKAYWDKLGVGGAFVEVGGKLFQQVGSAIGAASLIRAAVKGIAGGVKDGGANSAGSTDRAWDIYNDLR